MQHIEYKDAIHAWWFSKSTRLPHGDNRIAKVGRKHHVGGKIKACESGLHASVNILDALQYANGSKLWRVKLWGDVDDSESNKLAASDREYIAVADAGTTLREFARWCALQVTHLWDCPSIVREYLETGDESKRAAARAAAAAAWAARSAKLDAMARDLLKLKEED